MESIRHYIRNGDYRALCYNIVTSTEDNLGIIDDTVVYATILLHTFTK